MRNLRKYFYSNELFKNLFPRREHMAWRVSREGGLNSLGPRRHAMSTGTDARLGGRPCDDPFWTSEGTGARAVTGSVDFSQ